MNHNKHYRQEGKVDQKTRKSKRMGHMTKEERRNNKQDTRMTVEIGKIKKVG